MYEIKPYTTIVTKVASKLDLKPSEVDIILKDYFKQLKQELVLPTASRIIIPKIGTLFIRTMTLRSVMKKVIKEIREASEPKKSNLKEYLRALLKLRHEVYGYSKYRNRITQYKSTQGTVNPFSYRK